MLEARLLSFFLVPAMPELAPYVLQALKHFQSPLKLQYPQQLHLPQAKKRLGTWAHPSRVRVMRNLQVKKGGGAVCAALVTHTERKEKPGKCVFA